MIGTYFSKITIISFVLFLSLIFDSFAKDLNLLLSAQQIKDFNSIKSEVSIILPKYIPQGFKISKLYTKTKQKDGRFGNGAGYKIVFFKNLGNKKNSSFIFETTSGGVGDLMNKSEPSKVKTKFGEAYFYVDPISFGNDKKIDNCLEMEWLLVKNNFYRIESGECSYKSKVGNNLRISKNEAIKILESLDFAKL